jgi:hypothetical protein
MSGLMSPAAVKMSTTWSDATALDTICRMAESRSSLVFPETGVAFTRAPRTVWKKATSSRIRRTSSWGTDRAKA